MQDCRKHMPGEKKSKKCICFHPDLRQLYSEVLTEGQVTEDGTINQERTQHW